MYRAANMGARCSKWQRVPGPRGHRRLLRCRRFYRRGRPTGLKPANYGKTCQKMKRVYSPWYDKRVLRCAKYGPGEHRRPAPAAPVVRVSPPVRQLPALRPPAPLFPFGTGNDDGVEVFYPLSLPAFEKVVKGRTPVQMKLPGTGRRRRSSNPRQLTFSY